MSGALYRLMTWLSPAFPVGAYTYSHGLEWAIEAGRLTDRRSLVDWLEGILLHGAGRSDADLFREVWEAVATDDAARFDRAAEMAGALRGTAELALESTHQGVAFLRVLGDTWSPPDLGRWQARLAAAGGQPTYPVAVALACGLGGVALDDGLTAVLHALSANLISAAVRLVPLGQTDGQAAQAAVHPIVEQAVAAALGRCWDDLGGAAPLVDLCSMFHETQYTRLFRS
jgi:urease accessory protein